MARAVAQGRNEEMEYFVHDINIACIYDYFMGSSASFSVAMKRDLQTQICLEPSSIPIRYADAESH